VINDAFKHACLVSIAVYNTEVLMKLMQTHGIYLTKDQDLLGTINWLVKDLEAWDWLFGWWASDGFRAVLKRNRLSKSLVHYYHADRHICKTQRMV
jgi:hypothetical protein